MTASFVCYNSKMKRDSSLQHSQGLDPRVEEEDGKSKDMPKGCHRLAPRHGSPLPHRQTDHAKAPQPRKGLRSQLRSLFSIIIHHHIIAETARPELDDIYHHLKPSRQNPRACKTSLLRLARATDSRHLLRPHTRRAAADDISNQLLRLCEEESFSFSGSAFGD